MAHSLGGLFVKQVQRCYPIFDRKAIINAYFTSDYAALRESIKAVIFLGTPHRSNNFPNTLDLVLSV